MANKKSTGKKSSTAKKGKTSTKSKSKSNSKYVGKNKNYSQPFSERYYNAIMLSYIAGGIILGCIAFIPGYNLWEKLRGLLFSVFGLGLYLLVVQVLVIGVRLALGNLRRSLLITNISGFFALSTLSSIIHLINFSIAQGGFDEWKNQLFEAAKTAWNIGTGSFSFIACFW